MLISFYTYIETGNDRDGCMIDVDESFAYVSYTYNTRQILRAKTNGSFDTHLGTPLKLAAKQI